MCVFRKQNEVQREGNCKVEFCCSGGDRFLNGSTVPSGNEAFWEKSTLCLQVFLAAGVSLRPGLHQVKLG